MIEVGVGEEAKSSAKGNGYTISHSCTACTLGWRSIPQLRPSMCTSRAYQTLVGRRRVVVAGMIEVAVAVVIEVAVAVVAISYAKGSGYMISHSCTACTLGWRDIHRWRPSTNTSHGDQTLFGRSTRKGIYRMILRSWRACMMDLHRIHRSMPNIYIGCSGLDMGLVYSANLLFRVQTQVAQMKT